MRLFYLIICGLTFCLTPRIWSDVPEIWKNAYFADYDVTHTKVFRGNWQTIENQINNFCVLAYLFYRMGWTERSQDMFKHIDNIIEENTPFIVSQIPNSSQ